MGKSAIRLYKESDVIREADTKYFEVYDDAIHFGESPDEPNNERVFGFVQIHYIKFKLSTGDLRGDETFWVVASFFSAINFDEYKSECRIFESRIRAEDEMGRIAIRLYKESGAIQKADRKYFDVYDDEIFFGEKSDECAISKEFGFVYIRPVKLRFNI